LGRIFEAFYKVSGAMRNLISRRPLAFSAV
jgi:hypothetical protein